MSYGLYTAASGVLTAMYRQDVHANNLANVETVGFKPQTVTTRLRDAARAEDGLDLLPSNQMLERLGAGVLVSPVRTAMTPGPLDRTGDPMHVAVQGDGFLVVEGGEGEDRLRLTRDGRLTRRPDGRLVQAGTGAAVLDESERPISLGPEPFTISTDGVIVQNGDKVGRLGVMTVPDPRSMEKVGNSLFKPRDASAVRRSTASVLHEHLERSAADPIDSIMRFNDAAGVVTQNTKMIQLFDELMGRAINTFGRVA